TLLEAPPRFEQALGSIGVALLIEAAAQTEAVEIALEAGDAHDFQQALLQPRGILDASLAVIDPIRPNIELAIPGGSCFLDRARPLLIIRRFGVVGPVAQAEQQILADAGREKMRRRSDIADQPTRRGKGQRREIDPAQRDLAARRCVEPRQELRHQILAAIARADERDVRAEREREAEPVEEADAVAVDDADILQFDFALRRL